MSRMKLLFASGIASAFVFLCSGFGPVVAFADEAVEGVETSEIIASEEVVEETESVENTANDEVVEDKTPTFEEFLQYVGTLADEENFEDDWDKTVTLIKQAVSEKKVDCLIGLSATNIVGFLAFFIIQLVKYVRKKKYDTTSKDLKDIKSSNGAQTSAINGLIDETNKGNEKMDDSIKRGKALANATKKQNTALRCLIRGTNIKQDLKDEALRNLNESDDLCDEAKK